MTNNTKQRIFYFDALRAFAIIAVILIHIFNSTIFMVKADYALIPSLTWWFECFLGSAFRTGVGIFLMLSGALLLGRNWEIRPFLKKRMPRIVEPFLFWGLVLSVVMVSVSYFYPEFINTIDTFTISSFLHYLYDSYMAINPGFTQIWYFWMILGIYLILPVFNKWIIHSDSNEMEYFLVIWLITCIFDFSIDYDFPIKLTYFSGPIGLVVLGYYLRNTKRSIFNNLNYSLLILLIGFLANVIVCYVCSDVHTFFKVDRYSITNVVLTIGIFLVFKNFSKIDFKPNFLYDSNGFFRKSVSSISKYSYGMYFNHRVFMIIIYRYFRHIINVPELIVTMFIGTLMVSWLLMIILDRIPYIREIIGAK